MDESRRCALAPPARVNAADDQKFSEKMGPTAALRVKPAPGKRLFPAFSR
jgi:hypothetical protein